MSERLPSWPPVLRHETKDGADSRVSSGIPAVALRCVSMWFVCESMCVCYWGKGWILGLNTRPLICKWVDPWALPHTAVHTSTPGPTPHFMWSSQPWMCAFLPTAVTKIRAHQGRATWGAITGCTAPLFICKFKGWVRRCPWIKGKQHKHPLWAWKCLSDNFP